MSFFESMNVYSGTWFCTDKLRPDSCWQIVIMTKYLMALSAVIATYGYLIAQQLISSPFLRTRKSEEIK